MTSIVELIRALSPYIAHQTTTTPAQRATPNAEGVYYNTAPGTLPPLPGTPTTDTNGYAVPPPPPPPGQTVDATPPPEGPPPMAAPPEGAVDAPELTGYAAPRTATAHPGAVSIMDHIQNFLSPEPGSYWWGALHSGFADARGAQERYPLERQAQIAAANDATATATTHTAAAERAQRGEVEAGGVINRYNPATNTYDPISQPQVQPSAQERLIDRWLAAPEGSGLRHLIERMMSNYQYTPEVLAERGAVARDVARIRGRSAATVARERTRARDNGQAQPPTGSVLLTR